MEEFGDFLGGKLNNIDLQGGNFKNLEFQDALEFFGQVQHVDCLIHQLGYTLDLIISKERDIFA